jgi:hypothetical protein
MIEGIADAPNPALCSVGEAIKLDPGQEIRRGAALYT